MTYYQNDQFGMPQHDTDFMTVQEFWTRINHDLFTTNFYLTDIHTPHNEEEYQRKLIEIKKIKNIVENHSGDNVIVSDDYFDQKLGTGTKSHINQAELDKFLDKIIEKHEKNNSKNKDA